MPDRRATIVLRAHHADRTPSLMPPAPTTKPSAPQQVARSLPLLVVPLLAAVVSVHAGWRFGVQVGDTAWLTQRVDDVLSAHPPTLGMPSTLGGGGLDTHHPGPVQFYWLAPWWQLLGHRGIAIGSAAGAAIALTWVGVAARALPGASRWAAVGAQVAVSVGVLTVSLEAFADPWNPFAALAWASLLVVGAARVHAGDRRGWLGVGVAATVAAQLHVGYLPWALVLLAVLAVRAVRHPPSRPSGRSGWIALGAVAVLWLPPLIDLVAGIHNPVLIGRAVLDGDPDAETGPGAVVVAAARALSPLRQAWDPVWITPDVQVAEALAVAGVLVVAALSWRFGRRGHWARPLLAWSGGAAALWMLFATRAPLWEGLLAHSYVRPLWPLGALMWFAIGGVWWDRRPAWLARVAWVPALLLAAWVVTTPRGYVGIDPASRARGAEMVAALPDAPDGGLTLHAEGPVAGSWIAPALTATLDHRDVPNGVGTDVQWDHPRMSTRPTPLRSTACWWTVGIHDPEPDDELLLGPRRPSDAEERRLEHLSQRMTERFGDLEPSRGATYRREHSGLDLVPDEPVEDLVGSGRFAELVLDGLLDGVTLRDPEVAEFVELSRLQQDAWADVVLTASDCQGGPP